MNLRQSAFLTAIAAFTLGLTACGGGGGSTPPPPVVTVSLSGAPSSLTTSATASITATASNGAMVTWSVTCATSPCGTFSAATTASGAATIYTAPAAPTTVTITASVGSGTPGTAQITITAPAISVALNPTPPPSLPAGTTTPLTAVVTNDTKNGGVTWTVTCGSSGACGSFIPTSTASGTATTYTAPAAIPTGGTVTVTATSVTDTTKSQSATITITAPGISVAFNPVPPTSLIVGATSSLTAVVSNDTKNGGVTWTVTCGSSGACGSFSSTSTASGTATTYTAPAAIPTGNTVTVTATSVTDTTKSQSATITITAPLADGTYVYHFSGWDSTGPSFFAGAFTVAGGVITGGEQDFSDASVNDPNQPLVPANCSLSTAGGNIQIVLATADTSLGVNGLETLRGTKVSSSRVLISEYDTFGTGAGSIDLQTSAAAPSGGYAFAVSGWNLSSTISPLVIGGVLNISGSTISVAGSVFDYNVGGNVGQDQLFAAGSTVSAPDSFGRVTFTLTPATTSSVPAFILTGYIVGTNQIQLIESQNDSLGDDLGGMALGQGSKTGLFNQASVANTTYVFAVSGEDVNNLATFAGDFAFNSSGGLSGNLTINDFTYFSGNTPSTLSGGSYTVDATGRVTISNVNAQPAGATFTFQLYLDGNGNALELGADSLQVTAGPAYLQTSTSADFEGAYALVGQGILNSSPSYPAWSAVGPVTVSSDNITGSTDYNEQSATPTQAVPLTGTETNSTGLLSITGLDALAFTSPRSYNYIPIDNKRVLAIDNDGLSQGVLTLETISH
jgi:hypothetical protein